MVSSLLLNTVQLGVKSLMLHKLRSGLTMLGIIFGVCSVIAMLAIGEGASYEAQERIKRLGSTNVIINSFKPPEENDDSGSNRSSEIDYGLTYEDAARLQTTIPNVGDVVPMRIIRENIRFGRNQVSGQVIGTLSAYPKVQGLDIVRGRFLSGMDDKHQRNVCVITKGLAQRLFPYQDPLVNTVRIQSVYYEVIGMVQETGTIEQRPKKGEDRRDAGQGERHGKAHDQHTADGGKHEDAQQERQVRQLLGLPATVFG